jgi:hypothetical protein
MFLQFPSCDSASLRELPSQFPHPPTPHHLVLPHVQDGLPSTCPVTISPLPEVLKGQTRTRSLWSCHLSTNLRLHGPPIRPRPLRCPMLIIPLVGSGRGRGQSLRGILALRRFIAVLLPTHRSSSPSNSIYGSNRNSCRGFVASTVTWLPRDQLLPISCCFSPPPSPLRKLSISHRLLSPSLGDLPEEPSSALLKAATTSLHG